MNASASAVPAKPQGSWFPVVEATTGGSAQPDAPVAAGAPMVECETEEQLGAVEGDSPLVAVDAPVVAVDAPMVAVDAPAAAAGNDGPAEASAAAEAPAEAASEAPVAAVDGPAERAAEDGPAASGVAGPEDEADVYKYFCLGLVRRLTVI